MSKLGVPDFDMQYALAKMGVKSASAKVSTSAIVVGVEMIVEVNFEIEEWAGTRISLDIPLSDYYSGCRSASSKTAVRHMSTANRNASASTSRRR